MFNITVQLEVSDEVIADGENIMEKGVDLDIAKFSEFFQGLGNDPLIGSEKAMVKTYLGWKLGVMKKE